MFCVLCFLFGVGRSGFGVRLLLPATCFLLPTLFSALIRLIELIFYDFRFSIREDYQKNTRSGLSRSLLWPFYKLQSLNKFKIPVIVSQERKAGNEGGGGNQAIGHRNTLVTRYIIAH